MSPSRVPFRLALLLFSVAMSGCGESHAPVGLPPSQPPSQPPPPPPVEEAPAPAWTDLQLGGGAAEEVNAILLTPAHVIIGGYRNGTLGWERMDPGGPAEGFVTLLPRDGGDAHGVTLDTAGTDTVQSLALRDGILHVLGRTTGAFPGHTSGGESDLYVARISLDDPQLAPRVMQAGDERPQNPLRLAFADSTGPRPGLLIAGLDDLFIRNNFVIAWEDTLSVRLSEDEGGTLAVDWLRKAGTEFGDGLLSIAAGPDGHHFEGGWRASGPSVGTFVRRVDAEGETVWTVRMSPLHFDSVAALVLGEDGLLYAAGSTSVRLGAESFGEQDAYVVAFDPVTGEIVRRLQAGSALSEWVRDLQLDAEGNLYVGGSTVGALPGFENEGHEDAFVIRFATDGTWTGWQRGTSGLDEVNALAVDTDGSIYLAGKTEGAFVPGAQFGGLRDGFVVRLRAADLQPSTAK